MNSRENKKISVVIPCYNEQDVLPELFRRMTEAAKSWALDWEVICVDDGSDDNTWDLLSNQHAKDPKWSVISFSRNFRHQTAVSAGLFYTTGDAVIIIDADLQDPPEEIQVISVLFLGGVQLTFLGVLGQYLGRIYDEVKQRPQWIIKQSLGLSPKTTSNQL